MNISTSIERIQRAYDKYGSGLFLGTSGGKDSGVILHLALQVYPGIAIVHNPKSVTHEETVKFLYEQSMANILHYVPLHKMPEFISKHGLLCQIDGTRIHEADRTNGKSTTFVQGGQEFSRETMTEIVTNGVFGLDVLHPIYDWTDEQVFSYIDSNNIRLSNEYQLCDSSPSH